MQRKRSRTVPGALGTGPGRRRLIGLLAVLAVLAVVAAIIVGRLPGPTPPGPTTSPISTLAPLPSTATYCLSAARSAARLISRVTGSVSTVRIGSVADGKTYDLRGLTVTGYPTVSRYPLLFGKDNPGDATCVLGGSVTGRQSRSLTWQTIKSGLDGDGLQLKSYAGIVDGARVDNVEDGIGVTGRDPGGVTIRNAYLTYIRDDCIEDDAIANVTVTDSLLDGCFTGVSERPGATTSPSPPPPGEAMQLDRVLLRLAGMPYDPAKARCMPDGLGTGGFFKWSAYSNPLFVKNSIFYADRVAARCGGAMNFPPGTYSNVTLVWLGPGSFPGKLPASGVTVTRDKQIWDLAKADWLSRHGYPAPR